MSGTYLEYKELMQNVDSKSPTEECITPFWRTKRNFSHVNAIIVVCNEELSFADVRTNLYSFLQEPATPLLFQMPKLKKKKNKEKRKREREKS
jgi:hypothetical protein